VGYRYLVNEEAMAQWEAVAPKTKNKNKIKIIIKYFNLIF